MRSMTLSAFHSLTRYVTHVPSTYPPYDFLVTGVSHEIPLVGIRDVDPRPPTSTATDSGIRELSHLSGCLLRTVDGVVLDGDIQ